MPVLNEVAEEQAIEVIYYINTEEEDFMEFAKTHNIPGVPELLVLENGVLVDQTSSDKYQATPGETYEEIFENLYIAFFDNNK